MLTQIKEKNMKFKNFGGLLLIGATLLFAATGCKSNTDKTVPTLGDSSYLDEYDYLHIDSNTVKWNGFNKLLESSYEEYCDALGELSDEEPLHSLNYYISANEENYDEGELQKIYAVPSQDVEGEFNYINEIGDIETGSLIGYQLNFTATDVETLEKSISTVFEKVTGDNAVSDYILDNYDFDKSRTCYFAIDKKQTEALGDVYAQIGESSTSEVYFSINTEGITSTTDSGEEIYTLVIVIKLEENGVAPQVYPNYNNIFSTGDSVANFLSDLPADLKVDETLREALVNNSVSDKISAIVDAASNNITTPVDLMSMFSVSVYNYDENAELLEDEDIDYLFEFTNSTEYIQELFNNSIGVEVSQESVPIMDVEFNSVQTYLDSMESLEENENYEMLTDGQTGMIMGDEKLIQGFNHFARIVIIRSDADELQAFSNTLRENVESDQIYSFNITNNDDDENTSNIIIEWFY